MLDMKRIISMVILAVMMLSVAMPAMAAECYYYDSYGVHADTQDSFSYPTCTKPGYVVVKCSVCGRTYKEETGDAFGHEWEKSAEKNPTCTENGYISYFCNQCYGEKTETIKALGHKHKVLKVIEKSTCSVVGKELVECTRCKQQSTRETELLPHNFSDWSIILEATDSAMGVRGRYCLDCTTEQTEEFYPDGTLFREIDSKEEVKVLQSRLTECGYLNDKIDGIYGKKTEQAVKDFQRKAGFTEDGIAWPQTNKQLEKEWQILKGIYVEVPEVVCCTRMENADGTVEYVYCEEHLVLMNAVQALFEPEDTEEMHINALKLVKSMYQEEVDMLYTRWLDMSPEEEKANVLNAQVMFNAYLKTQQMIWDKQYGADSREALNKANDMLHSQWIDLCAILQMNAAE